MNDVDARELAQQLQAVNVPATVDEYAVVNINAGPIEAFITQRPHYCDRGRWLVNATSVDGRVLSIDAADAFPRYYFFTDCLVKEISHWLHLRLSQAGIDTSCNLMDA